MLRPVTYDEALASLRNHSNLGSGAEGESLLWLLRNADKKGSVPQLAPSVEDVLSCLAVANRKLNGPVPSKSVDRAAPHVIADLAYPVSGLLVGLLQYHRLWSKSGRFPPAVLDCVRDAALRITMAWDMLVAGDHDDLRGELEDEWNSAV